MGNTSRLDPREDDASGRGWSHILAEGTSGQGPGKFWDMSEGKVNHVMSRRVCHDLHLVHQNGSRP